jgi:hypothetical protein
MPPIPRRKGLSPSFGAATAQVRFAYSDTGNGANQDKSCNQKYTTVALWSAVLSFQIFPCLYVAIHLLYC